MLCKAYQTSYNLPIIVTRGNNVYGPRQFPEKLIPKHILCGMMGRPLPVHGQGSARRSYLYVSDVADAFDKILHKGRVGEIYNIGTDDERQVIDIATKIAAMFKVPVDMVKDRAFNDSRYFIGHDKLENELDWCQTVTWEDGLQKTVDWYMKTDISAQWANWESALSAHPRNLNQ
jgi:UDP-glucose 4,6-dehydratase